MLRPQPTSFARSLNFTSRARASSGSTLPRQFPESVELSHVLYLSTTKIINRCKDEHLAPLYHTNQSILITFPPLTQSSRTVSVLAQGSRAAVLITLTTAFQRSQHGQHIGRVEGLRQTP